MNKEHKIRNEEGERPNMIKAPSIAVGFSQRTNDANSSFGLSIAPDESGKAASSIAVGFSQRTGAANSSGLLPHILKMWLKPIFLSILCRWLKPTANDRAVCQFPDEMGERSVGVAISGQRLQNCGSESLSADKAGAAPTRQKTEFQQLPIYSSATMLFNPPWWAGKGALLTGN